jgi:polyisoprenoid-binding protein YceI
MSTAQQAALTGTWNINPVHSFVTWSVRHAGVSWFRGYFDAPEGKLDATGPEPVVEGSAKVENISIRSPDMFREHVLGPEFFDAANFPEIRFRSTKFEIGGDSKVTVEGELTIRGTTKSVTGTGTIGGPAETPMGTKLALELTTTINRFDFGVSWEAPPLPTGGRALGEEVQLQLSLQLDPAE